MGFENDLKSKSFENEINKNVCGCRHSHFFDRLKKTLKTRFLKPPPTECPTQCPTDPPPSPALGRKRKGGATPLLRREILTRDCKANCSAGQKDCKSKTNCKPLSHAEQVGGFESRPKVIQKSSKRFQQIVQQLLKSRPTVVQTSF